MRIQGNPFRLFLKKILSLSAVALAGLLAAPVPSLSAESEGWEPKACLAFCEKKAVEFKVKDLKFGYQTLHARSASGEIVKGIACACSDQNYKPPKEIWRAAAPGSEKKSVSLINPPAANPPAKPATEEAEPRVATAAANTPKEPSPKKAEPVKPEPTKENAAKKEEKKESTASRPPVDLNQNCPGHASENSTQTYATKAGLSEKSALKGLSWNCKTKDDPIPVVKLDEERLKMIAQDTPEQKGAYLKKMYDQKAAVLEQMADAATEDYRRLKEITEACNQSLKTEKANCQIPKESFHNKDLQPKKNATADDLAHLEAVAQERALGLDKDAKALRAQGAELKQSIGEKQAVINEDGLVVKAHQENDGNVVADKDNEGKNSYISGYNVPENSSPNLRSGGNGTSAPAEGEARNSSASGREQKKSPDNEQLAESARQFAAGKIGNHAKAGGECTQRMRDLDQCSGGANEAKQTTGAAITVNDACGPALRAGMAKEARHHPKFEEFLRAKQRKSLSQADQHDVASFLSLNYAGNDIMEKYREMGCNEVESTLESLDTAGKITDVVAGAAGQGAATMAVGKTQESQMKNGYSMATVRDGYRAQASALEAAVGISATQTAANLVMGIMATSARRTTNDAKAAGDGALAENQGGAEIHNVKDHQNLDNAGLSYMMAKKDNNVSAQSASDLGAQEIQASMGKIKEMHSKAENKEIELYMKAGVSAINGAAYYLQAQQLRKLADGMVDQSTLPVYTPLVPGTPGSMVADTAPPPVMNPGGINYGDNPISASEDQMKESEGSGLIPPPMYAGGGTPGGLLSAPPPGSNGMVGPGNSSGGGGGSLGGGGGGGGGGNSGGEERHAEMYPTDKTKFEGTGGAGFTSNMGGGGRRGDGTTGSNPFAEMLAGLLPKQEDLNKDDITKRTGRGPSSEGDDGSILGKDANLFKRNSDATMRSYKMGRLR